MAPNGSPTPKINIYDLTAQDTSSIIARALQTLKPRLPTSIALYRRLQFGRFLPTTRLLTNLVLSDPDAGTDADSRSEWDDAWVLAFVDRSCRPETEAWVYASWEDEVELSSESEQTQTQMQDALILALIRAVQNLNPTPKATEALRKVTSDNLSNGTDAAGYSRADYAGHMSNANVMLWGAVHERTSQVLRRVSALAEQFASVMAKNFSFVWIVDEMAEPKALPEEMRWGELERRHLGLVRSRTQIPRQEGTLAVLPNQAIFTSTGEEPIAWAFAGLDGSLTSLHVEEPYRGKGLAKSLTTKLFRDKMECFWEDGVVRQAHGYVTVGNVASQRMCEGLGGKSDWECYWLRVDLGKI
ncbi:Hypothetical protein R9X50_00538900 [Acrodontium crateriforme]|uniref:GCN5-related N-acetyltransferase Rv2170-like domain-containing protein n=1 Tax=Acrodontium crateriforme TaxID=150365 RepID=A0AAQ3M6F1_9PEZI|nr:Hypothetical protein R9X50_00538900 [Acrodontium crateriforme]